MPNKYPAKKGWNVPKQAYKLTNWSDYNAALCRRGEIDVWLSLNAVSQWYDRIAFMMVRVHQTDLLTLLLSLAMKYGRFIGYHFGKLKGLSILYFG